MEMVEMVEMVGDGVRPLLYTSVGFPVGRDIRINRFPPGGATAFSRQFPVSVNCRASSSRHRRSLCTTSRTADRVFRREDRQDPPFRPIVGEKTGLAPFALASPVEVISAFLGLEVNC